MVFEDNVIFSANEQIGSHSVTKYDELSTTVSWSVPVTDAKFEVPIVRGMGYATALYEKISPKVTLPNMITVNDQSSGEVSGKFHIISIKTTFKNYEYYEIMFSNKPICSSCSKYKSRYKV